MTREPDPAPESLLPSARERVMWGVLLAVMLGVLAFGLWRVAGPRQEPPPVLLELPEFSLTHHDGREVGLETFAGSPWVADFVFTRCPGICPRMTRRMAELAAELGAGSPVRLVSFTVDPEHDTPEVLAAYARRHGAGERWYFLTGEREEIYRLCRDGFKLAVSLAPEGASESIEPILHSNRLVLVDGKGRIRGYYDAFDESAMARLVADLGSLL